MKSTKFSKPPNLNNFPLTIRQVHGHSMVPVLPPGTFVYGWRWFRSLKVGDVVIFLHDNKEKIKRIQQLVDGRMYVVGDHEDSSTDSRHFGWLNVDSVVAKVFWPHAPKHRAEGIDV